MYIYIYKHGEDPPSNSAKLTRLCGLFIKLNMYVQYICVFRFENHGPMKEMKQCYGNFPVVHTSVFGAQKAIDSLEF